MPTLYLLIDHLVYSKSLKNSHRHQTKPIKQFAASINAQINSDWRVCNFFLFPIHSQADFVQCAISGIQRSVISDKDFICSIPSLDILGLHPVKPFCQDTNSSERMFSLVMKTFSNFNRHSQKFGCRYWRFVIKTTNIEQTYSNFFN